MALACPANNGLPASYSLVVTSGIVCSQTHIWCGQECLKFNWYASEIAEIGVNGSDVDVQIPFMTFICLS